MGSGQSHPSQSSAAAVGPALAQVLHGQVPVRFVFWDGSALGPDEVVAVGAVRFNSPQAITRIAWAPGELGVARAYVSGDIDIEGDLFEVLRTLDTAIGSTKGLVLQVLRPAITSAFRIGAVRLPPPPPAEEAKVRGILHSKRRDAEAVTHHYDVGNDFYEIVLGPAMTYSCARFVTPEATLAEAQEAKHDLVCRKLGLHERSGARLLDVGCGWGSLAIHAARNYGASVVGITLSPSQAKYAREAVDAAGLGHVVEIRQQDYRDLRGERFDAISSIGMFEHVGERRMAAYFETLVSLLAPGARLLNHAISKAGNSKLSTRSFIGRYVFPDGELLDVAEVVAGMERAGLEVRDVESLREHYARTLREWVGNLEAAWDEAVDLVGEGRARVWRLYMAASANGFERGSIAIHQVLGVRMSPGGASGMEPTRRAWG